MKKICWFLIASILVSLKTLALTSTVNDDEIPYKPPIGFTLNAGAMLSTTFEGRFLWGLAQKFSIVISPSYQNTPTLPLYHPKNKVWSAFDFKRAHLGIGVRYHFYEYDSRDGWFVEPMVRAGVTWLSQEELMGSVIPSFIFGYAAQYESGFFLSFGLGLEWEFLLPRYYQTYNTFLRSAYFGVTKLPLTGEASIGWMW